MSLRTKEPGDDRRSPSTPPQASRASAPTGIAALQQLAGNAAVTAVVQNQAAPVQRTASSGEVVQRMFSRWTNRGQQSEQSGQPQQSQQSSAQQIAVGDEKVPMTWDTGFWVFRTSSGGTGYIDESQVNDGAVAAGTAHNVLRYMYGGFVMYRGIGRWHPTWGQVTGENVIPPLGRGRLPDFDTHNTSFVPFAPTENIASGAAVSARGMGQKDRAEYVTGYRRTQGDGEVGLVATVFATPDMDLGFFNETEIQIRGPIPVVSVRILRMSTTEHEALGNNSSVELRETRPGTPSEDQKKAYTDKWGGLIP